MTTLTEGSHNQEALISENVSDFAREQVTLISGQNLKANTILGKISASGKYTILAPSASSGAETAAAVLLNATDASGGDKRTSIIKGGPGVSVELNGALVVWPSITNSQKSAAIAQLESVGIKIR